jgi:hypothetical protein
LSDGQKILIERISEDVLGQNELFVKTEAVAGLTFASTGVAVIIGLIALIGRVCHARHTRSNHRIFFCLVRLWHARKCAVSAKEEFLMYSQLP